MERPSNPFPFYVIKAVDLAYLNFLDRHHPRPRKLEWINRGTNQPLRATSVDMLIRTLFRPSSTPSVRQLHETSGLRAYFSSVADRDRFALAFGAACAKEKELRHFVSSAVFEDGRLAREAVLKLKASGVPAKAIAMMWRAGQFLDSDYRWKEGHSGLAVAGAVASGGIAGALLGAAIVAIPGFGALAVAGMFAASAVSAGSAMGGVIGATGGAIAKMLTDHDVDGVAARIYEEEISRGKVFVSIDSRIPAGLQDQAHRIFHELGGKTYTP